MYGSISVKELTGCARNKNSTKNKLNLILASEPSVWKLRSTHIIYGNTWLMVIFTLRPFYSTGRLGEPQVTWSGCAIRQCHMTKGNFRALNILTASNKTLPLL
jgi:hypothetical protein